jgi:hypothetical protein
MGRQVRRVPLTFDWPMNKVWKGFLNPHFRPCPAAEKNQCVGGYSPAGKWLDAIVRFLAMIGEQAVEEPFADQLRARGQIFPHPYLQEFAQAPRTEIPHDEMKKMRDIEDSTERQRALYSYMRKHPAQLLSFGGEEMIQFITGLANGKKPDLPFGGSSVGWEIQKTLMKAAGIDPDSKWGHCKVCDGHGIDPAVRETYENWEKEDPPTGEGWQLWETVSEGSPVSPVCPTKEAFVEWLVKEDGYSRSAAEKFCDVGWVPSGLIVQGGPEAGVYKNLEMLDLKEKPDASQP